MLGATARSHQKRRRGRNSRGFLILPQSLNPGAPLRERCRCSTVQNDDGGRNSACRCGRWLRVFQADSSGGVQCVGEDRIDHKPKDETLKRQDRQRHWSRVRAQANRFRDESPGAHRVRYAITLRNHKTASDSVEVNEPVGDSVQCLARRTAREDGGGSSRSLRFRSRGRHVRC